MLGSILSRRIIAIITVRAMPVTTAQKGSNLLNTRKNIDAKLMLTTRRINTSNKLTDLLWFKNGLVALEDIAYQIDKTFM